MKKLSRLLLVVFLSTILVSGLVFAQETEMKTYSNDQYAFEVSYPKGWTKTEMNYKGIGVLSVSAYPDPHNVNISASELKKDLSLEKYIKAYDLRLDSMVRYQNVVKRKTNISGFTALVRVSTTARSGGGGTRGKDVYLKKGEVIYNLSFSTSVDSYEEAKKKYFDQILESFDLN